MFDVHFWKNKYGRQVDKNLKKVTTFNKEHTAWRSSVKEAYLPAIQGEIDARNNPSDPIHPARMMARVREVAGDDAIYVIDGGDTSYFGATTFRATKKGGCHRCCRRAVRLSWNRYPLRHCRQGGQAG